MAERLTVASMRQVTERITAAGQVGMREAVTAVALAGERQAKTNASTGAHRKGTRTPATRYQTGPARISGNLVRSVTHTPAVQSGTVFTARIGVAGSAPYGKWVEAEGYAFMEPTARFLRSVVVPIAEEALRTSIRTALHVR